MIEKTKTSFSKKHAQWATLGIFLVINIFIWAIVARADRQGELLVAFLDVGQGDAIYIETPHGNQILIDGGSGAQVLRALGQIMPFYDRTLDLILATHPDQDHIGGFSDVMNRLNVDGVITTENTSGTSAYKAFEKSILNKHPRRILARAGERIILDNDIVLEILFPDRNARGWETNTSSIVARLFYGKKSFLFTGDSPQEIERYLVNKKGGTLHSTVLKLGHHGSRTSSSKIFLSAVDPEYAIISAGKNNKYGHPHKEVLTLLSELAIPFRSTAEQGTIIFRTKGAELEVN
ncbi:MAG: MBL fold metallo-hydrolase [Candidatus Yonathbacteria bacterium]|nr:MBL fold metallo-hydrolase [Candidatus Yonathbacteria bacterium]